MAGVPRQAEERFDLREMLPGERYCASCATRVCGSVRQLTGVLDAECDVESAELVLSYDPQTIRPTELRRVVHRVALEEADAVGHAVYRVEGLD